MDNIEEESTEESVTAEDIDEDGPGGHEKGGKKDVEDLSSVFGGLTVRPQEDGNGIGEESVDIYADLLDPSSASEPSMDRTRQEDVWMDARLVQSTPLRGACGGRPPLLRKARFQGNYRDLTRRQ